MKKCPNCGACQECGHVPPTWMQPWPQTPWVVPSHPVLPSYPTFPQFPYTVTCQTTTTVLNA